MVRFLRIGRAAKESTDHPPSDAHATTAPDKSLLVLLEEVRRKTLMLLEGVSDRQARWAPPGLRNTMLWHGGHCYVLVEFLTSKALGRQPQMPAGWFEMFSWISRPDEIPASQWPPLGDVIAELQSQHDRLRSLLSEISEKELAGPVRQHIVHALHDEACHSGEMWLLRKLQHVADQQATMHQAEAARADRAAREAPTTKSERREE